MCRCRGSGRAGGQRLEQRRCASASSCEVTSASTRVQATARFHAQIYQSISRHFDFDQLKVIIIASPGFVKEAVMQSIFVEATVRFGPLLMASNQAYACPANEQQGDLDRETSLPSAAFDLSSRALAHSCLVEPRGRLLALLTMMPLDTRAHRSRAS